MTTVVYRDGILASDSQMCDSEAGFVGMVRKIAKIDNCLIGACGDAELSAWFLNNFTGKMFNKTTHDPHKTVCNRASSEFQGIIISPKGKMFFVEESLIPFEFDAEFSAIGSGSAYAMGALHMGATAEEAVKISIKQDKNSGGKIQKVKLSS